MPKTPDHPELCEFLDDTGWQPNTVRRAAYNLARWETWLRAAKVDVMAADHRQLRQYLTDRAATAGGTTRLKEWQHVRAFYRWAATPLADGGPGLLTADPMLRVKAPVVDTGTQRMATPDVAARLEEHFVAIARLRRGGGEADRGWRNAAMVSLMMRAGVRSCEIPGIDLAHLVRDGRGELVACQVYDTKNRRERLVPLTDETPRLLARYLRRRGPTPGPLFAGREAHTAARDGRLSANAVQQIVRRGGRAIGVTVSAHDFRRGWAVESASRGVDRGWLKIIGGWTKDDMLDRYLGPERRRLAVDEFHAAIAGRHTAPRLRAVPD